MVGTRLTIAVAVAPDHRFVQPCREHGGALVCIRAATAAVAQDVVQSLERATLPHFVSDIATMLTLVLDEGKEQLQ